MHDVVKQKECVECKKKDDIIEVIQEQYNAKVEEVGICNQRAQKFE